MQLKGVLNRIAWVDLTSQSITIEEPGETIYKNYLGGYGIGAFYLYHRQPAKAEAMGPENTLGFTTGPLTGTSAITGNRFTVVGKSPKTGGWGDANCGGAFGPAMKKAGLDAVFFTGITEKPVYAVIEKGGVTLHDASGLWGKGCLETEDWFRDKFGKKAHSAVIGSSGENASHLACIINDKGRAAGRSGLGGVMGSKRLKGVVALATGNVPVAEEDKLAALRKKIIGEHYNEENGIYDLLHHFGTPGVLEGGVVSGDAPIKNWQGWIDTFPKYNAIDGDAAKKNVTKPYGCWRCPIACGAHAEVAEGPYAGLGHRPEYETLAAFGTACLNDNLDSICRINNICNDAGMDTISAGATVAFAIECFEKGIITKEDTDGLELTWGNHGAMVRLVEQMASGDGFGGEVLGDGIREAVNRLGKEAATCAMEAGGEELPYHDPRAFPGLAISYAADATPGRHTQFGSFYAELGFIPPELGHPEIEDKYNYSGKGDTHKHVSNFGHVINMAGVCQFASCITPAPVLAEFLGLAMGVPFTMEDVLEIGERAANLRIAFNLREGIRNKDSFKLPGRVIGDPPLTGGPTKGVTVDNEIQLRDYYAAMGWNPETGVPKRQVFDRLGLEFAHEVAEP